MLHCNMVEYSTKKPGYKWLSEVQAKKSAYSMHGHVNAALQIVTEKHSFLYYKMKLEKDSFVIEMSRVKYNSKKAEKISTGSWGLTEWSNT